MRSSDFPGLVDRLTASFPKRKYARGGQVTQADKTPEELAHEESAATFKDNDLNATNWWDRASQNYDLTGILRDPSRKYRRYSEGGGVDGGADPDRGDSPSGSVSDSYGGQAGGGYGGSYADTGLGTIGGGTIGGGYGYGSSYDTGGNYDQAGVGGIGSGSIGGGYGSGGGFSGYDGTGSFDSPYDGGNVSGESGGDSGGTGADISGGEGLDVADVMSGGILADNLAAAQEPNVSPNSYSFSNLMTSSMPAVTGKGFYDTPVGQAMSGLKDRYANTTTYDMFNDPFNQVMSYPDMDRYAHDKLAEVAGRYGITPSQIGLDAQVARSKAESPNWDVGMHPNGTYSLASWRDFSPSGRGTAAKDAIEASIKAGMDPFTAALERLGIEYYDPNVSREFGLGRYYDRGVQALQGLDPVSANKATLAFERPESPLPGNRFDWNLSPDQYGNKGYVDAYNAGLSASSRAAKAGGAWDYTSPTAGISQYTNQYTGALPDNRPAAELTSYTDAMQAGRPATLGPLDYATLGSAISPQIQDPNTTGRFSFDPTGLAIQSGQGLGSNAYGLGMGIEPTDFKGNGRIAGSGTPETLQSANVVNDAPPEYKELIDGKNIMGPALNIALNMFGGPIGLVATLASYGITGKSPGYAVLDKIEELTGQKGRAYNPDIADLEGEPSTSYGSWSPSYSTASAAPAAATTPASAPSAVGFSRDRAAAPDYENYGYGPAHNFFV